MTKKSTHWVTIPEETVHTPASQPSKKGGKMSAKSKFFWGAGFVAVVIVTVALLAPQQMANILQGNLFEQSGFQPLEVIPEEEPAEETSAEQPAEQPIEQPAEQPEDTTVVEAETDAVTIQIEPVTVEEPVEQPVEEQPSEEPAEETEVPDAVQEELDANRQLLEELSKQIAEFKEKDQEKTAIIEDLADIVQDQIEVRPSAPTTVPPAVSTTTAIGQVPTGYRVNTHIVTMTPQQVLQQNTAQLQMQQTAVAATSDQQIYRDRLAQLEGTTDSGPKEALLIALSLAFIALLGWKIGKLAKA